MRIARWVILSALALVGSAKAAFYEHNVGWSEVPPAARATIEREARGAPIVRVQREFDHGMWLYEAKVRYPGHHKTKIEVDPYGNVVHIH